MARKTDPPQSGPEPTSADVPAELDTTEEFSVGEPEGEPAGTVTIPQKVLDTVKAAGEHGRRVKITPSTADKAVLLRKQFKQAGAALDKTVKLRPVEHNPLDPTFTLQVVAKQRRPRKPTEQVNPTASE